MSVYYVLRLLPWQNKKLTLNYLRLLKYKKHAPLLLQVSQTQKNVSAFDKILIESIKQTS